MSDYSSIVFNAEENGSAREDYDEDRGLMTASVTLRCAYADRHTLAGDICGNLRPWPKGTAGLVPLARGAGIVPAQSQGGAITAGGQIINFDALVTIHYTTKNQEIITESFEPTAEFITLDHRWFRWGSGAGDPLREDEAPGVLIRGINFVRNELFVVPPLPDDLLDKVGYCNAAPYFSTFMGRLFDVQTLLMAPPTVNRKIMSIGDVRYDLTKKFTYKSQGWNTFFNQRANAWQNIYLAGASSEYDSYPVGDLSVVLPPTG